MKDDQRRWLSPGSHYDTQRDHQQYQHRDTRLAEFDIVAKADRAGGFAGRDVLLELAIRLEC